MTPRHVVTGAFGYSGKYIARLLLQRGIQVTALTNSPNRPCEFAEKVIVAPLSFDVRESLVAHLRGAEVLYNTYWVRFDHRNFTHQRAVNNTCVLFDAARRAGVKRIVHISITHPSAESHLPYFSGKARLESALHATGIPSSILRPAVLFGGEDILINNIAWALRRFPLFGIPGGGQYGIRPIHVNDLALLALQESAQQGQRIVDAVGPEAFTFRELVESIGRIIGRPRPIVSMPPTLVWLFAQIVGRFQRDVFLTREEIEGLMQGLLASDAPATGATRLTDWAHSHADSLGRYYASEMRRRRQREAAYAVGTAEQ